jgi:hypothetical protein
MPKGLPSPTVPLSPGTYVHGPEGGIEYWAPTKRDSSKPKKNPAADRLRSLSKLTRV